MTLSLINSCSNFISFRIIFIAFDSYYIAENYALVFAIRYCNNLLLLRFPCHWRCSKNKCTTGNVYTCIPADSRMPFVLAFCIARFYNLFWHLFLLAYCFPPKKYGFRNENMLNLYRFRLRFLVYGQVSSKYSNCLCVRRTFLQQFRKTYKWNLMKFET